jgi:hypothetical protein
MRSHSLAFGPSAHWPCQHNRLDGAGQERMDYTHVLSGCPWMSDLPTAKSAIAIGNDCFTSTPAVSFAQIADIPGGAANGSERPFADTAVIAVTAMV